MGAATEEAEFGAESWADCAVVYYAAGEECCVAAVWHVAYEDPSGGAVVVCAYSY